MQKVWYYETSVNYNCAKPLDILPNECVSTNSCYCSIQSCILRQYVPTNRLAIPGISTRCRGLKLWELLELE